MAIKNLFGRGLGFNSGAIHWIVTRGYGAAPTGPAPETDAYQGTLLTRPALDGAVSTMPKYSGVVLTFPA